MRQIKVVLAGMFAVMVVAGLMSNWDCVVRFLKLAIAIGACIAVLALVFFINGLASIRWKMRIEERRGP